MPWHGWENPTTPGEKTPGYIGRHDKKLLRKQAAREKKEADKKARIKKERYRKDAGKHEKPRSWWW